MKKAPVTILLAFISLLFCSCNKLSIGDLIEETRLPVDSFQVVEIRDDIDVSLRHSNADTAAGTVFIKTGANLIDAINAKIEEHLEIEGSDTVRFSKLVITNDNSVNYLRPYNHTPQMTVYYDTIYKLIFHSNGRNIHTDTLRGYNYPTHFTNDTLEWDSLAPNLILEVEGGSGNFNVLTNCYKLISKYIHGTSILNIKGKATIASTYADYDCHGIINNKELDTHIYYITTYSTNVIKARTYHMLDVTNGNIGEVHFQKYFSKITTYFWNDTLHQTDSIVKTIVCPEVIHYNGDYLDPWTYNNEIPGLKKEP